MWTSGLTMGGFLDGLAHDPALRAALTGWLRAVPHRAFCWELPPLTNDRLGRPFEHVAVDSPALARAVADPEPFREHFGAGPTATFWSLRRDSLLVAPTPLPGGDAQCAHLAAFVRGAPPERVDALWVAVAAAVRSRLGAAPIWLSTAGLGVSWLHVRVDDRPKYIRTAAYRSA